ncbi:MAG TPA: hypothetical protein VHT91_09160, partial [Kofleriaceae bacterium]|nr:hypothetical protein [Kofleriaceae bacterium]
MAQDNPDRHPGIVPVHEAGRWPEGARFDAMKLVSCRSLRDVIVERRAVDGPIADAHRRNIVHPDLKPGNEIVGDFGETIVIDWGLAKDIGAPDESSSGTASGSASECTAADELTAAGGVLGTPAYMAPEQKRGKPVDQRADVLAIGAMWYPRRTFGAASIRIVSPTQSNLFYSLDGAHELHRFDGKTATAVDHDVRNIGGDGDMRKVCKLSGERVTAISDYRAAGSTSWFVRPGGNALEAGPARARASQPYCVAVHGNLAAWGYTNGTVLMLDTASGTVWSLRGQFSAVNARVVMSGRRDLRVWELKQPARRLVGTMPCKVYHVWPSPDGAPGFITLLARELGYPALLDEATRAGPITYVTLAPHDPKSYEFRKSSSR